MNDRVERAARALARRGLSALGKEKFDAGPEYYRDQFSASEREEFEESARAAIEAAGDEIEFKIAKLELGPRDVLVVKSAYHISDETVLRVKRYVRDEADVSNPVLVIQPDLDLAVLTRSDIERLA